MQRSPMERPPLPAALLVALLPVAEAASQQSEPTTEDEIRHLKERVAALEETQGPPALAERLSFSGLIETEATYLDAHGAGSTSNLVLATAELGINLAISDWIQAGTLFLYEEDTTPLDVDVGLIRFGNRNRTPFYAQAGQYYVPFGHYGTAMVSDPLTLTLGEIRESAIQVGIESSGAHAALYTFNGDTTESGEERVDQFGAHFGYRVGGVNAEVSYLSNLADADTLQDSLPTLRVSDYIGAVSAHAEIQRDPFAVLGEFVTATEAFDATQLAFEGAGARPRAANLEGAYTTRLMGLPATIALGVQHTDEALAVGLPATRALTAASLALHSQAHLSLEWARDEDYDTDEGGTGEQNDRVTLQLSAAF